jgi:hypothetical protein
MKVINDLGVMRTDLPMSTTVSCFCAMSRRIDRMLTFSIPATSATVSKASGAGGALRGGTYSPFDVSSLTARQASNRTRAMSTAGFVSAVAPRAGCPARSGVVVSDDDGLGESGRCEIPPFAACRLLIARSPGPLQSARPSG